MLDGVTPNPHATPLIFVGDLEAPVIVILLHDEGSTPQSIIALAERLELAHIAFITWAAADARWFPANALAPLAENRAHLELALERVHTIVDSLIDVGRSEKEIAFFGLGQGASLACEYVYRHPLRWRALIGLCGGLLGEPQTEWAGRAALSGMPMLLCGDEHATADRIAETTAVFRAMGAEVDPMAFVAEARTLGEAALARARGVLSR